MIGGSEKSGGSRLIFPIIAALLLLIALLFLISNRNNLADTDAVTIASAKTDGEAPSMGIADTVIVPLSVLTMPFRGVERIMQDARERSKAFEDNQRLKKRLSELADAEMRANALAMKIKRFENLLSADVSIDIPVKKIAGRVVSENNGPFARSALLNVGAKAGVKIGHAVMTEDGLYGHVVAAGSRSSRVLLLEDINSRIAVMSNRSEARAIMVGTNSSEPKLLFVARDADWLDGDRIVTSGDEGVLPRGLPVGSMKFRRPETQSVVLDTLGKPVDWVWVFPYTPFETPEEAPFELTGQVPDDAEITNDIVVSASDGGQ